TAEVYDYGNLNVNTSGSVGTSTTTVDFPIYVNGGALGVQSRNVLDVTANGNLNYALYVTNGFMNVGAKNDGDTATGTSSVICRTKGSIVTSSATLDIYGLSNTWSDTVAGGGLELTVQGKLSLLGSTLGQFPIYRQTTLEFVAGNVAFSSTGTLRVYP